MSRQLRRISIWAVLLLICLGQSRLFLTCAGSICQGSVELAPAACACCLDQDDDSVGGGLDRHQLSKDRDDSERESVRSARCACNGVALSFAEGPLPKRHSLPFHSARVVVIPAWLAAMSSKQLANELSSRGGPLRGPRRTELLATTHLLS